MSNPLPQARFENLVVQELQDEVLIYDLVSNKAHCLNASAAFIWRRCDGTTSANDIASAFAVKWKCDAPEDFVTNAIGQLNDSQLLQHPSSIPPRSPSRRHLLKKLGVASAVALPLVQSLVAPTTLYASVNCSCTSDAQCITQTGCPTMTCGTNGQCIA